MHSQPASSSCSWILHDLLYTCSVIILSICIAENYKCNPTELHNSSLLLDYVNLYFWPVNTAIINVWTSNSSYLGVHDCCSVCKSLNAYRYTGSTDVELAIYLYNRRTCIKPTEFLCMWLQTACLKTCRYRVTVMGMRNIACMLQT